MKKTLKAIATAGVFLIWVAAGAVLLGAASEAIWELFLIGWHL